MAKKYAKVDANIHSHPKIQEAGFWGYIVYTTLLCLNRKHEFDGAVPRQYCSPKYIAWTLNLVDTPGISEEPTALIKLGLNECARSALIEYAEDNVIITGYDDDWAGPKSSAERIREWREKERQRNPDYDFNRAQKAREKYAENVLVTSGNNLVTSGNEDEHPGNGVTTQTRPDQTRKNFVDIENIPPNSLYNKTNNNSTKRDKNHTKSNNSRITVKQALKVANSVIEFLNRKAKRKLQAKAYVKEIQRLLKEKYTESEMRLVIWWAIKEWGNDDKMRKRITPSTLFKMNSPQGFRTFPAYLSEAMEMWETCKGSAFDRDKLDEHSVSEETDG